jgi:hypothetical protein
VPLGESTSFSHSCLSGARVDLHRFNEEALRRRFHVASLFECMQAIQDQITALGFYRDIIVQNVPKIADEIGILPQTLHGWTEGKGERIGEKAQ